MYVVQTLIDVDEWRDECWYETRENAHDHAMGLYLARIEQRGRNVRVRVVKRVDCVDWIEPCGNI